VPLELQTLQALFPIQPVFLATLGCRQMHRSEMQLFNYMVGQDQADARATNRRDAESCINRAREAIARSRLLLARAEGHLARSNVIVGRVDNTAAPARSDH
jgi:hypothetical protein